MDIFKFFDELPEPQKPTISDVKKRMIAIKREALKEKTTKEVHKKIVEGFQEILELIRYC